MTPKELEQARATLGGMWRLGEPLTAADLGRLLHIDARDPGATVRRWETGKTGGIPGPVRAFVEALLAGYVPPSAPQGAAAPMEPPPPQFSPKSASRRRG